MLPLSGVSVLVTRPVHQAAQLVGAIGKAGGRAVSFPVIGIGEVEDDSKLRSLLSRLSGFDIAIFVSANAVEKAMERIASLPPSMRVFAVGRATLSALQACGVNGIAPERQDSEGLLDLLADVSGSRIVIFRGEGGREKLAEELKSRGAAVEYAECYRRMIPEQAQKIASQDFQAVTATSGESVKNLLEMTGNWILKKPIFVPHERIGEMAKKTGFERVFVTRAGDDGLVEGLIGWYQFGEMHGNG